MKVETITYVCDLCGKKLKYGDNRLNIRTPVREENPWSDLHVKIIHRHGYHNDVDQEDAELCKSCATKILGDAKKRVEKGERASAGTQGIEMERW